MNGKTDREAFDGRLEFDVNIIPYTGDDSWVEGTIQKAYDCISADVLPESNPECEFCLYRRVASEAEKNLL